MNTKVLMALTVAAAIALAGADPAYGLVTSDGLAFSLCVKDVFTNGFDNYMVSISKCMDEPNLRIEQK